MSRQYQLVHYSKLVTTSRCKNMIRTKTLEKNSSGIVRRRQCLVRFLTLPSSASRSVVPWKVAALMDWVHKLLLTVRSRSASGVVTVLDRPSTAAFSSYSFLMISSCRASRALTAGSTSPFCGDKSVEFEQFQYNFYSKKAKIQQSFLLVYSYVYGI